MRGLPCERNPRGSGLASTALRPFAWSEASHAAGASEMSLHFLLDFGALGVLLSVVVIDVVLAGDNTVVVGTAAAGLPPERRCRVILWGIFAATVLRTALSLVAVDLLAIIDLTLAGGILLLWVA